MGHGERRLEDGKHVWRKLNGEELDVTFASPAYVRKLVVQDWGTVQCREAKEYLFGGFDQWTICQVSRKVKRLARVRWCQWLVGHLPTWQWVIEHSRKALDNTE